MPGNLLPTSCSSKMLLATETAGDYELQNDRATASHEVPQTQRLQGNEKSVP